MRDDAAAGDDVTAHGVAVPTAGADERGSAPVRTAGGLVAADVLAGVATGAPPLHVVLVGVAMAGMVVAGAAVLRDPGRAGLGGLLLGVAAAGSLADLAGDLGSGPFPFAAEVLHWPYVGLLAHLLLRWPDARLDGILGRALLLVAYGLMPLLSALRALLDASGAAGGAVLDVQQLLHAALIGGVAALVLVRAARARGPRRLRMWPVSVAALLLAATAALGMLQRLGGTPGLETAGLRDVAVLAVPIAVLVAERLHRAATAR